MTGRTPGSRAAARRAVAAAEAESARIRRTLEESGRVERRSIPALKKAGYRKGQSKD